VSALRIVLYVIAAWFGIGAIGLFALALGITHRRQQAVMIAVALLAAGLAVVEILAAGDLR
jgi:hypothetical protein